jgi:pimeloyl-ACP methyl ester carboxylesterase
VIENRRFVVRLILALVLTILFSAAFSGQPQRVRGLVLADCEVPNIGKAKCGTYEVFENRTTKTGRKIELKILVLPATGSPRAEDPFVYIPGGPGSSATEDATGLASAFGKIREHRDLLFIDQRGTGGSHPLKCKFFNEADPQSYLGYFFPLDQVRQCRRELEPMADLTLYTTPIAMDDLDEVRAALGYERLNLFGGSYGTRAVLVYMKRHPDHVSTAMLQGISPTNQLMPRDFPQSNERALQGIIAECAADKDCQAAFPNLQAETKAVLDRLLQGPIDVEINPANAGLRAGTANVRNTVKLSRDLAAEAVRYMLYSPPSARRVPLFLHLASQGNFTPLATAAVYFRTQLVATGSNGLYLSITCAEDLGWIKPGDGERLAQNTFLGDYRLRQQREACALWPRASIPKDYAQPTKSSAPVLLLTGELDPVTPPSNAEAVARSLPNSLQIVVPHGAHGIGGLQGIECVFKLMEEFVESGTTKGLNTTCVKNISRGGFALKL